MEKRIFAADAFTVDCCIEAGIPASVAHRAIVDGPRATPQRARTSLHGRTRTQPTTQYVWGADLKFLVGPLCGHCGSVTEPGQSCGCFDNGGQ